MTNNVDLEIEPYKPDFLKAAEEGAGVMHEFNTLAPDFHVNRYSYYRHFREHDPVHKVGANAWYLFRYEDVISVLKDGRFLVERNKTRPLKEVSQVVEQKDPYFKLRSNWMVYKDPPDHTRLRSLVNKAFTPHLVEGLRPRIEEITNSLLDKVRSAGEMDLIADLAFPLPAMVIAEILGVNKEDLGFFQDCSMALQAASDVESSADQLAQANQATMLLAEYLKVKVLERRQNPRDDLISDLIAAEDDSNKLSEEELLAMCILLLFVGHETTSTLIGNGALALLRNPSELEKLRDRSDLIENGIEELLRYDSPVQMVARHASEDVVLGGKQIKRGDFVICVLGSANRDPQQFAEPDKLDVARDLKRHCAFGSGVHFCLGASLARAEAQIAIKILLQKFSQLKLQVETPEWKPNIAAAALKILPVSF